MCEYENGQAIIDRPVILQRIHKAATDVGGGLPEIASRVSHTEIRWAVRTAVFHRNKVVHVEVPRVNGFAAQIANAAVAGEDVSPLYLLTLGFSPAVACLGLPFTGTPAAAVAIPGRPAGFAATPVAGIAGVVPVRRGPPCSAPGF